MLFAVFFADYACFLACFRASDLARSVLYLPGRTNANCFFIFGICVVPEVSAFYRYLEMMVMMMEKMQSNLHTFMN